MAPENTLRRSARTKNFPWLASLRWMLGVSLLIRALIPDGFMPGSGHWVELCTAHGTVMVQVDLSDDRPDHADDDPHAQACPWSAYFCGLDGSIFRYALELPTPANVPTLVGRTPFHQRLATALPPPRGPPCFLV
ncbi:MAG: DUF2946 family protein [Wenzhouxiangella sp.]